MVAVLPPRLTGQVKWDDAERSLARTRQAAEATGVGGSIGGGGATRAWFPLQDPPIVKTFCKVAPVLGWQQQGAVTFLMEMSRIIQAGWWGEAVIWTGGDEGRSGDRGGWEEQQPSPPQRGPSTRVSHPIWICNEMIASSRNLAAFSQNAIARKSHWSKELMDETIPISQ